ncbi:nuclear transport factor 2 family protein [Curtobacterium sp. MCPF17_047]|uniref:nuclear transport factor 2 family protein n=1 Tax=unclassified Curtobacterium TaxID=257496 RepID=UPI000DA9BEA8|nr:MULTISPECIES: nuclear transport factor 2 family protein [unclassified Curtobacterium]PZE61479.1 nuclear transport factor 2 family protein [Curtobacterium sp. MCPF17_001]PZF66947.1 nuclear transport factor 2 family protein [Curtobacterium sp. MCPF17_047]
MLSTDDRLQISETLARQAFMVDENALDQLGEVFTPDATYDMTSSGMGAFEGLEALRTAAGQLFASGHAPLSHFVTNIVISETGESTASVRSKGLMIMAHGGVHGVVYDDTVVLHEGRWLIASRVILPLRTTSNVEH